MLISSHAFNDLLILKISAFDKCQGYELVSRQFHGLLIPRKDQTLPVNLYWGFVQGSTKRIFKTSIISHVLQKSLD